VPDAQHLPHIDYSMMQEMAESGAKVLNAQAVEWAKRHRVVLHARRTEGSYGRDAGARETIVGSGGDATARAVVTQRGLALLRAPAAAARALLDAANRAALPLRDLALCDGTLTACAPLLNVPDLARVRGELARPGIPGLVFDPGFASVSVIGVDVGSQPETIARALGALDSPPSWMLSTPLRLTCVLEESRAGAAERAFHACFAGAQIDERLSA
jgi:aspartate kinase